MKINLERCITAPFSSSGERSLVVIYLIAVGLSLITFFIQVPLAIYGQITFFLAPADLNFSSFMTNILFSILISTVGPLLINLPVLIPLMGYWSETIRLEYQNEACILPVWQNNWAKFLSDGFKIFLILLVYILSISALTMIPVLFNSLIVKIAINSNQELLKSLSIFTGIASTIIAILLIFIFIILLPFIMIHFSVKKNILAAFDLKSIFSKVFSNLTDYFIALILSIIIVSTILFNTFALVCSCVGVLLIPLLVEFIFPIMILNLFTQIYKDEPAMIDIG